MVELVQDKFVDDAFSADGGGDGAPENDLDSTDEKRTMSANNPIM